MRCFEDFRVGDVYRLGMWKVGEQDIVEFASMYDPQPRHTDVELGVTASGWHVAGIFMRLYVDAVLRDSAAEVSPGLEHLRWLAPVLPGAVLTGSVTVMETQPAMSRPDCGIVQQRGELINEDGNPVLRVDFYGMIKRSSAIGSAP
ncbi:hypothetical protein CDO52_00465 [Nocardiopsis gilva YIM 90087]|uniref:Uncharacterized protein n=1 Tax=Nocardiopsis gilva YIM 90087 TaxID=1235441 RepID=A0A223S002_9ACTN|nr:MaoC/PaaZ C-terminal domain-containing protein [Nocardiopsis gilva]ASU81451.1 hypothetical protein CDO52_00465 [Nocardiopsis gilva YIM 90087]